MRQPHAHVCAIAAVALLAVPALATAQYTTVPPAAAYALEGVTVVQADGRRAEGVTIVVRGGFIESMGPGLAVPADARRLEGDSLVVYPGLIDAWGDADYAFPEQEIDRSQVAAWDAPRALQGFMPSRLVWEHLTATGGLAGERRKGVVAAAVHPDGAMMPGRGTFLLLRPGAATPGELVLEPVLGPTMTWRGGPGVYPATLFGVTAFMRQSMEDARRRQTIFAAYRESPRGIAMPTPDPDYAVLQEVLRGDTPVFFHAADVEAILRTLRLAEAYGFRVVIVGGDDAWKVAGLLRERDVPVLIDTDFPAPQRWAGPDADSAEAAEPMDAATQREKQRLEDLYANAGRLAASGVTFALTSGGGGADLRQGAARAIQYGLDPDAALRALTTTPAALLGAPELVRIETGVPATFVVADGPLFGDATKVVYTFVEGAKTDGASGPAAGAEAPAVDITGTWSIEIESDAGIISGTMRLTQDGAAFQGSVETEFGPATVRDGVVSGAEITFVVEADQSMTINFTGTVEGDEASGTGSGPIGSMRWTAQRTGAPGRKAP